MRFSVAVRNAAAAAIEATIGASAVLKIRTGVEPINGCSDPDSGTVLATLDLPADWLAAPSGGAVAKAGTWRDLSADASGTAGHFRLYASDGTTCHGQGDVTATGGGGDLELNTVTVVAAQVVTITAWTLTEGNP